MKALIYLLRTSIINYFKRIKEKPQKAIGMIFPILWVAIMLLPRKILLIAIFP
ncbi:MAG: putative ABC exporter domain-containing protein [Clostridium sp.]|uniref:putative ABC exporter domain-containing protein n=1 Tax=Clostridium sp. TaxID=1506 RepID=UPI0039EC4829